MVYHREFEDQIAMRIIFVTPDYPDENSLSGSGVGTSVYNISHGLAECGHDSVILVCGQPGNQNKKIGKHITILYTKSIGNFHYYMSRLPFVGKAQFLVFFIKQWEISRTIFEELKLLYKETGINDTVLEIPEAHGNFLLWKKNRWVPYVVVIHGSLALYAHTIGKNKSFFSWLMVNLYKVIMRGSSAIVCPSRFVSSFYEKKLLLEKVFYCPNPVSLPKLKASDNNPENKIVVLSVSALSQAKGIDTLMDAIEKIARVTKDIRFVIIGSDGDMRKKDLDTFFSAHHLSGLAQVVGYIPWKEIRSWYQACDIFVSASRLETFGQTIAEAMLCGKPVIATSAGAIPELLDNGQSGILVKPGDSSALAQEIMRLASDRRLCKELGLRGMQKILTENSPARAIQERIALYRNILDESKSKVA